MNLQKIPFSIQNEKLSDIDDSADYPTIADLMREQSISENKATTVHQRRDLDSLG